MAENVILAAQTLSGFTLDGAMLEATAPLVVGKTYTVKWDGVTYECVGQDGSVVGEDGIVAIGNLADMGGTGNGEPFGIAYAPASVTGSSPMLSLVCLSEGCESDTHTVAIYQVVEDEEPETPPEEEPPEGIVLKDRNGNDVAYYGIETVTFDTTIEGKQQTYTKGVAVEGLEIVPDFSGGDMAITATDGTLVKSATIKKPETEEITFGDSEGAIPLDFSGGNLEAIPSSKDKFISKVTIEKPETLRPENVAKDVEIAGIVGTHEGGGDVYEPEWIDDICFWDYDGTLILHIPVKQAAELTELPVPPDHTGLVFAGWNYTLEEIKAAEYPRDVGAIYRTSDGKTHITLEITSSSYLAVPICFSQTVENGVTIDWGDGSTSTVAGTGCVFTTHTYAAIGTYEVTLTPADGCALTLGGSDASFVGATGSGTSNGNYSKYLTALFVGDGVSISARFVGDSSYLSVLTLPPSLESIPDYALYSITRLSAVIVPRGVTLLGQYNLYNIGSYNVENNRIISVPETLESLSAYCFYGVYDIWRIVLPSKVTELPSNTLSTCPTIRRIFMPDTIVSAGNLCRGCYALRRISLPSGLAAIGDSAFYQAGVSDIVLPLGLTTIGTYFCAYSSIKRLVIKGKITSVGSSPLSSAFVTEIIVCTQTDVNDAIKRLVSCSSNYYRRLYVPDSAVTTYKNALSSDYKQRIYPLSEYNGSIPD